MSVLNQSGEEQVECPLCLEPLEVDDLNFFPCTCGYQICRFCWHRIRTDENGLCPACRKAYSENPADFKPLSQEEMARLKAEKRHKDQQRKQKITENRKHLANIRVVQRNLVFVVGLPLRLADAEVLKKHEYFGKFGKIQKVVINQSTSYAGSQGPSASAYVTYLKADDALRAIQAVNNISVDGRTIKTSLGTTKYCSHFMKNQSCPKSDCMYLHELGDAEASFTKEEMQQGKHQEYEKKLHEQLLNTVSRDRKPTPPPSMANCQNTYQSNGSNTNSQSSSSTSSVQSSQSCSKEAWPSLQPGVSNSSTNGNSGSGIVVTSNGNNSNGSRRQQANKVVSGNHKKRHTSGEEIGKTKEKAEISQEDEVGTKSGHAKVIPVQMRCSRSSDNSSSSSSNELDTEVQENEGRQQLGSRILPASQRAALFGQDNNSFFSSNSFTKVATTASGTNATDWPVNGLTLTHMPDVLPPVHSSEDWQAAFGFTNSATNPPNSQNHENNCVPISCEEHLRSVGPEHNEQESQSVYPSSAPNLNQEFRLHTNNSEHLAQKSVCGNSLGSEEGTLNPAIASNSGTVLHQGFPHSSFVHQDPSILMMQHQQYPMNNLMNGLPPCQASSKFVPSDFHLLKEVHVCNHSPFVESGGKLNMSNGTDFIKGGRECKVTSDCGNNMDFISGFMCHQQKNLDLEFKARDRNMENLISMPAMENCEEISTKDNGRLTDDELGFDPFHETQKALAEMMEKENMMSMVQNKQAPPHAGVNHLTQHLYHQYHLNQVNHLNHQAHHNSMFGNAKHLSSYYGRSQHILPQQNHRLPPNVSNCTKLLDGLGLGPASGPTRTRLPPPGFTTAPNHMNAFGLGIPRAPTSNSSKILPFMGLGNSSGTSSNGASSPIPQSVPNHSSTSPPVLFNPGSCHTNSNTHSFALHNGLVNAGVPKSGGEVFGMKEWSLLPGISQYPGPNTPPPPVSTLQKGWTGIGPCADWTALDPAIVSTSCQNNYIIANSVNHHPHPPANPSLHVVQQSAPTEQQNHWLRSMTSDESGCVYYGSNMDADWTVSQPQHNHMIAPPPPGFPTMRQGTVSAKNQSPVVNMEMGKSEISDVSQTDGGMLQSKEEDRMEGLR